MTRVRRRLNGVPSTLVKQFVGLLMTVVTADAQLCGDPDLNGTISLSDGVNVLRAAAGLDNACSPELCDSDGNGVIGVTDGVNVLRAAAGLEADLICGAEISAFVRSVRGGERSASDNLGRLEIGLAPIPGLGAPETIGDVAVSGLSAAIEDLTRPLTVPFEVPAAAAQAGADPTLLVAAARADGTDLRGFFELTLDPLAGLGALVGVTFPGQLQPGEFRLRLATRSGGVVSKFREIPFDIAFPSSVALRFVGTTRNGNGTSGLQNATAIVISPDGAHVYVTSDDPGSVVVFRRDAMSGALTFVEAQLDGASGVDGIGGASSIAISADGASVYVTGGNLGFGGPADNSVAVFRRDPASGALTFVQALFEGRDVVGGLAQPYVVDVSPDGRHVYVASLFDGISLFERNTATGGLTFVERQVLDFGQATAVLVSADGRNVYATTVDDSGVLAPAAVSVFRRDVASGRLTFVDAYFDGVDGVAGLGNAGSLVESADGASLYVAGTGRSRLTIGVGIIGGGPPQVLAAFRRSSSTGELSFLEAQQDGVGGVDGSAALVALASSPDGARVYAASEFSFGGALPTFQRSSDTGRLTFLETPFQGVGGVTGLDDPRGVAASPDGDYVYVCGSDAVTTFGVIP